jgi:hypothetical protein
MFEKFKIEQSFETMERETISKNRASLKSHTSKGNLQLFVMLAFVLSAFVFAGCNKDDDSDSGAETFEGVAILSDCEKLEFKTDGTLLYYDVCISGYDSKGHYTLTENKLTLVYDDSDPDGDSDIFTVKEKTKERIVVSGENEDEDDWIITLK